MKGRRECETVSGWTRARRTYQKRGGVALTVKLCAARCGEEQNSVGKTGAGGNAESPRFLCGQPRACNQRTQTRPPCARLAAPVGKARNSVIHSASASPSIPALTSSQLFELSRTGGESNVYSVSLSCNAAMHHPPSIHVSMHSQ